MWDGLGFFGFDDTKLDRIKGKEVGWCTPLLSIKSTPLMIIGIVVMAYIIINEAGNLGKQKSQTIDLQQNESFTYNIEEAMPLIGTSWFFNAEVFPRAREY
jgi:hypothetical protein